MSDHPNVSRTAHLIADPARSLMLTALLDGRAFPAGELAYAAGVTPQTASSHLAKLLHGGLVVVETEGRHRYYRLAGAHVAQAIEQLATIQPAGTVRRRMLSAKALELQFARRCYDHLAGRLGVTVTRALQERGILVAVPAKQFDVTPAGVVWFASIGLDVAALKPTSRGLARQCLDWTERIHHLAGPLGVALLDLLCQRGWLQRFRDSRAIGITPRGYIALEHHLGIGARALKKQLS